jgi:hypothetical protein
MICAGPSMMPMSGLLNIREGDTDSFFSKKGSALHDRDSASTTASIRRD